MKVFDDAIRRPMPTFLLAILVVFFGLWTLGKLPVKRAPSVRAPMAMVVVPYVGATPDEVESEVTLELEEEIIQVDGLRHLTAVSSEGSAALTAEFEDRTDVDEALRKVRESVDRAEAEFDQDVEVPLVMEMSTDDEPIISFVISGGVGLERLRQIAEDLRPALEAVEGVSEVDIFGGSEPEVRIFANPSVLAEYGLTLADLSELVRRQARSVPSGQLRGGSGERLVRATGEFRTLAEIRSLVVTREPAGAITLGDVAEVELHHKRRESDSWLDGEPSVTLVAKRKADVNTVATVEKLKATVRERSVLFPADVHVTSTQDASEDIGMMLSQLGTSAVLGLTMLLGVLFATFGWRQALLVASVLPFSLLFTFIGLYTFDMSISNMSIFSLILVLGLVVDGAIIVAEAIYSEFEDGHSPLEAASRGIHRVGLAVFAADFTTIAAFFPMVLMVGIMGQFMSVMPKVVVFAIVGSIFVDHFLIPAAAARVGFPRTRAGERPRASERHTRRLVDVEKLKPRYGDLLNRSLRHPGWLIGASALAFFVALGLVFFEVVETIFIPSSDRSRVVVRYASPLGTPLEETSRIGRLLAQEIETLDELERYVLTTGTGGGANPFGMGRQRSGPERGSITVELVKPGERERSQAEVADELRARFERYAGIDIEVSVPSEGGGMGSALALRVQGPRFEDVVASARQVETMVRDIEGAIDVQVDYERSNPELRVEVDRTLAGSEFSLAPEQISRALLTATVGVEVGRMWIGEKRVDLRVSAPEDYASTLDRVKELPLRGSDGRLVPLGSIAHVSFDAAPRAISRYDTYRTITVSAAAATGYDTVALTRAARAGLRDLSLPDGVAVVFGGQTEERARSMGSLRDALGWGLLLIYVILAIQFNSLVQPFIVMACVPLSIVGVTLGLLLTATPFSFSVFIGIVSLTGIVVNDGIVMIDGINQARRAGQPLAIAVREASIRRLRPVILTTVTTVAGIFPLTLNLTEGGEFWVPLGIAIISGLLLASLLTLFVIPAIYTLVEGPLRESLLRLVSPDAPAPRAEPSDALPQSAPTPATLET